MTYASLINAIQILEWSLDATVAENIVILKFTLVIYTFCQSEKLTHAPSFALQEYGTYASSSTFSWCWAEYDTCALLGGVLWHPCVFFSAEELSVRKGFIKSQVSAQSFYIVLLQPVLIPVTAKNFHSPFSWSIEQIEINLKVEV